MIDQKTVCVLIDKPHGCTSHDVVSRLRKMFPGVKMGHGGTLDPFATGVLPVFFGDWTKVSSLFSFSNKRYIATLTLGKGTDTGDYTGKVIKENRVPIFKQMELSLLSKKLTGTLQLPVPIYSALKVDGTPMHELARKGILTESIRTRNNTIYKLTLECLNPNEIKIDVTCSHGTYIRSLGEYIANQLKTCGHLSELRRVEYYQPDNNPYPFQPVLLTEGAGAIAKAAVTREAFTATLPTYIIPITSLRNWLLGKTHVSPLRINGWHHLICAGRSVGVVLFEKGFISQRMFFHGLQNLPEHASETRKVFEIAPKLPVYE